MSTATPTHHDPPGVNTIVFGPDGYIRDRQRAHVDGDHVILRNEPDRLIETGRVNRPEGWPIYALERSAASVAVERGDLLVSWAPIDSYSQVSEEDAAQVQDHMLAYLDRNGIPYRETPHRTEWLWRWEDGHPAPELKRQAFDAAIRDLRRISPPPG